jgi:hypothetical protein
MRSSREPAGMAGTWVMQVKTKFRDAEVVSSDAGAAEDTGVAAEIVAIEMRASAEKIRVRGALRVMIRFSR